MADPVQEVIQFVQPHENEKCLYLTNISCDFEAAECVQACLREAFSKYGLIYEIFVKEVHEDGDSSESEIAGFYAFVNYFSAVAASNARKELTSRLYLKRQNIKIRYATRRKPPQSDKYGLYIAKCYELANHYLGFNGWAISITSMSRDEGVTDPSVIRYFCVVKLNLPQHGITTEGVGAGQNTWNPQDVSTKAGGICCAKKRAYQRAVENAFSRIVLVILPGGRVYADVNTTLEDNLERENLLSDEGLLKVTEVEGDPADEIEDTTMEEDLDMADLLNKQILKELEEG